MNQELESPTVHGGEYVKADMESKLDAIAEGKLDWQQYLTSWNRDYFTSAISLAKQAIPRHLTTASQAKHELPQGQHNQSRTPCPQCQKYLVKIPSSKVAKKYFLKCISGCTDVVLFWSEREKKWHKPQPKEALVERKKAIPVLQTEHKCPVCKKPLEEYSYQKEGQPKKLLRCSDSNARNNSKHKEAVYFHTEKGWWSPKFGELG